MLKKNYANQIRNQISSFIEEQLMIGNSLEEGIQNYMMSFYQLNNKYSNQNYILKILILGVGYLDAYKIYSYKQKEGLTNDKEVEILGRLMSLEGTDDLLAEASADPNFLFCLIAAMNEFYGLDTLEKIMLMDSLSNDEHELITEVVPLHNEDISNYGIEITLDTLKEAYIQKKFHQTFIGGIDFDEAIMMNLCGFVKNLLKFDYHNAQNLICDIAALDYAALCVLSKKGVQVGYVEERIDLYKNNTPETILYTLINVEDFLKCAIYVAVMTMMNGSIESVTLSADLINTPEGKMLARKLTFQEEDEDE